MPTVRKFCNTCSYHPQRSLGQGYVFTCVCDSVHRGLSHCMLGYTDPHGTRGRHSPPPQPPRADTSPGPGNPDPSACWKIRATSGRYASYWNAILFCLYALILLGGKIRREGYVLTPFGSSAFAVDIPLMMFYTTINVFGLNWTLT